MIAVLSFTRRGAALGRRIRALLAKQGDSAETYAKYPAPGEQPLGGPVGALAARLFSEREALVFIGAAGIAVRAIAPCVARKDRDPAVLVVDESGAFVIPVLSGHIGGANALAVRIAGGIAAVPVLTTATDVNGCFAVDTWAVGQGLAIGEPERVRDVSAALLRGETVSLHCEYPLEGPLPRGLRLSDEGRVGVCVAREPRSLYPSTLHLYVKEWVVGVGCRKGIAPEALEARVAEALRAAEVLVERVWQLASVELKREEPALLALAGKWRVPFRTFPAETLAALPGAFTPSAFVESVTGVDNVCERAAVAAAGEGAALVLPKTAGGGVTVAIAKREWRCRF